MFHIHCEWFSLESTGHAQLWSENLVHRVYSSAQSSSLLSGFMFGGSAALEAAGTGQASQPKQVLRTLLGTLSNEVLRYS